jgi:hypothetical protein
MLPTWNVSTQQRAAHFPRGVVAPGTSFHIRGIATDRQ